MCKNSRVSVAGEDIAVTYQEDARRWQTIQAVKIIMKSERSANNASIGWSKREIETTHSLTHSLNNTTL